MSSSPPKNVNSSQINIIDEKEIDDFETTNESFSKMSPPPKQSSPANTHQENQKEEIKKLKEKIKWLEDALKKKDKLYEDNFKENESLKKELDGFKDLKLSSSKISESDNKEKQQLKAEVEALQESKTKEIKEKEALSAEIQVLKDLISKKLEETNKDHQQLSDEVLSLTEAKTKETKEKEVLLKKILMLEETIKLKEGSFAVERQTYLGKIEDLSQILGKSGFEEMKTTMEIRDMKPFEENRKIQNEENGGLSFLNPIMKVILYMLLAVYVSFYVGCDRLGSLFKKNKA
jgi:chromosome segregation ATPase